MSARLLEGNTASFDFTTAGFTEIAFDDVDIGVGTVQLATSPPPFRPGRKLFRFIGDGTAAHL